MGNKCFFICGFFICLLFLSPLQAFDQKTGFYFGFVLPYTALTGESFGGDTFQTNGAILISIPKLEPQLGFAVLIGHRNKKNSYELGYSIISHDSSLYDPRTDTTGPKGKGIEKHYYFNYRLFKLLGQRFSIQGVLGISYIDLLIDDAYYVFDRPSDTWKLDSDARLPGLGLIIGGGFSYHIIPRLSIMMEANFRPINIGLAYATYSGSYTGPLDVGYDLENMGLNGLELKLAIIYIFSK